MFARDFDYDRWANQETLRSLQRLPAPPAQAVARLAHIAAAQQLWWERIHGLPPSMPVWPALALEECGALLAATAGRLWTLVAALEPAELARPVVYANSKGERFESAVGDILRHLVLHGAYHRGQIASDVRAAGGEPAYTDLIHAVRSGHVAGSSSPSPA